MHLYLSSEFCIESEIMCASVLELNLSGFSLTFLTKYKNNRASSKSLLFAMGYSKILEFVIKLDLFVKDGILKLSKELKI